MVAGYRTDSPPQAEEYECQPQAVIRLPIILPSPLPPSPTTNVFNQLACLTPHLYLAAATALNPSALTSCGISLVINATAELPLLPVDGARSVRVSVGDDTMTNLYQHLDTITTTIREEAEQGGVVLVHCVAGVSRSATLCLAYLTKYYCSLGKAWRYVKTIRPWVRPNYSFMEQLGEWEKVVRPHSEGTQMESMKGAEVALISVALVSSSHVLGKHENERTGRDSHGSASAGYLSSGEDDYADFDYHQEDSLGTYVNQVDQEQSLNNQQRSRQQGGSRSQSREGNNQISPGNNSQFGNRQSGQLGGNFGQFEQNGGQGQGQGNRFGNQQGQSESADGVYGALGQGQGNNNSQTSQNQRRHNQRGQKQQGQNQRENNQRGQSERGQNQIDQSQRRQNQGGQSQSADRGYGAPGRGNTYSQTGQNQRGQNQREQNQEGNNQRGNNQIGQSEKGQSQIEQSQRRQNQRAQAQSADGGYGSPGQSQNDQGQRRQTQRGQNQRENIQRGQIQRGQNQAQQRFNGETSLGQFGSSGSNRPTINRFLPSSQSGTRTNDYPSSSPGSNDFENNFKFENTLICPGGTVEYCIQVCPRNNAPSYQVCVQRCYDRCDDDGQGAQSGNQGNSGPTTKFGQQGQQSASGQFNQQGQFGQFGNQGGNGQSGQFVSQSQVGEAQLGQYGK